MLAHEFPKSSKGFAGHTRHVRLGSCPFAWTPGVGRAHVAPLSTSFILAGIVHEVPSPPGIPPLSLSTFVPIHHPNGPTIFYPSLARSSLYRAALLPLPCRLAPSHSSQRPRQQPKRADRCAVAPAAPQ